MTYSGGPEAFIALGIILAIVIGLVGIGTSLLPSSSRRYRRMMADLFVAGRIKQLAHKKDIDLPAEYEAFKKWLKKQNISEKPLDVTLEEEIQEDITDVKEEIAKLEKAVKK